jgi:hypothetical protein
VVGKLWDGVAGKLAERWLAQSVPAFVFWAAAVCAWVVGTGGPTTLDEASRSFGRLSGGGKAVVIALALVAVGASIGLVDRLVLPVLRLLEGYWPAWVTAGWGASGRLLRRRPAGDRLKDLTVEYLRLSAAAPTAADQARLVAVQQLLRRHPTDPDRVMPTAVGNVLRAMEDRPRVRYGLEPPLVWPHLWFVLPPEVRADITAARAALDRSVTAVVWGAAGGLLVVFTPWALVPTVLVPVVAYRFWVRPNAVTYADLVGAAFDLYRWQLYRELHLPRPPDARTEPDHGLRLNQYLLSGNPPQSGFTD